MSTETPILIGEGAQLPLFDYSLTTADFTEEKKPQAVELWKFPQQITRPNFISYTVQSFGASRGCPEAQAMYMHLVKARTGFDGFVANRAFKTSGGWHCLTQQEQEYFQTMFVSVRRHQQKGLDCKKLGYRTLGGDLVDNLRYNYLFGSTRKTWGREIPIDYDQSNEEIFQLINKTIKDYYYYKSLQID